MFYCILLSSTMGRVHMILSAAGLEKRNRIHLSQVGSEKEKMLLKDKISFSFLACVNILMLGRSVSAYCVPSVATGCTEGAFKAVQEYGRNPTSDISKLCKANDDMWSCLIRNRCDVSELKPVYEMSKRQCNLGSGTNFGGSISEADFALLQDCNSQAYIKCIERPIKVIQDWSRNPTITESNIKKICKASSDVWNCVVTNNCEVPALRNVFEKSRQQCAVMNNENMGGFSASVMQTPIWMAYYTTTVRPQHYTDKPKLYNHDAEVHYRREYYYQYYNSAESMRRSVVTSLALSLALISLIYRSLFDY